MTMVVTACKTAVISDDIVLGLCNIPTNCTVQTTLAAALQVDF